jgi:DNA-directed RNA polymerase specialized sigma24 family protein
MNTLTKEIEVNIDTQKIVKELYECYAMKLLAYTRRNYNINEDDAMNLVYKTIYRIVDVYDRYHFENEQKRTAFIFKTHINYLRNYYRDNKSFENRNFEVEIKEFHAGTDEPIGAIDPKLSLLQKLLDKMEDWQRILLLMRGQGVPYNEISKFVSKPEKQLKVYYARLKKQLVDDMNEELNKLNNGKK